MSTEADIVAELMAVVRTLEQHGLSKNGRVVRSAVKELERLRAERDAAARDMRERAIEAANGVAPELLKGMSERYVSIYCAARVDAADSIRGLSLIATDGETNG